MLLSSEIHATGFITDLNVNGEPVLIGQQSVAAIVNREPRMYSMEDAGYLDKEPVTIEVLQGTRTDTRTVWLLGESVPLTMGGTLPQINGRATVDGIVKKIVKVQNAQDRWIITTIKLNTAANQQQQIG